MPEVAPEGAAVETAEVEAPAEQAFSVSPEEWQQTQEQLQQLQQVVQPQPPAWQQQPQGPPIPDPFADNYAEQLQTWGQSLVAPYQQFQEQMQLSAAQEEAMGVLDEHAGQIGDFDRDMAWARANQIILDNGGDPRKALEQAAKETLAYEKRVGEAYHQQQIEAIQNSQNAGRPVPQGNAGAQGVVVGNYGNVPGAVTNRIFNR